MLASKPDGGIEPPPPSSGNRNAVDVYADALTRSGICGVENPGSLSAGNDPQPL
jgi:hypothetical protein